MNLSEHFTLEEMTYSANALRANIENTPWSEQISELKLLCTDILEKVRLMFGPVTVDSGYRSSVVNRLIQGSSSTSQHCLGQAADIVIPGKTPDEVVCAIMASDIPFDQLISEWGWTHISRSDNPRHEVLRAVHGTDGKPHYIPYRA